MPIFKCKMCGGDLTISEGIRIIECDYCGTNQTVPSSKDENLHGLYNRANTLRMKAEFDKAEQLYEKILQADECQAEAYWGLILCRYGVEYVEDPKTFKRIPTCHRTSFDSIVADSDYKSALKYADALQKSIYEKEAKEIDRIQKKITELSSKEEPYDVFICYKETDNYGKRTQDSVIANDIYHQLKQEGFKVFYAAITLEDKLGSAYEPCIFAALNSAKVMLTIGTKPEYFNAVWVKNEWSRFLRMMKNDRSKLLIPCYKDMDAYDLPEEFSHLQAQDISKLGFMQDLIRGIKKIVQVDEVKTTVVKETVVASSNANAASLLERAFLFLEDGEWESADEYCEKVLDIDPKCAEAYLGKLMVELQVKKQENLKDCEEPFDGNNLYQKVIRFGDDTLKTNLTGYTEHIYARNESDRLNNIYTRAKNNMFEANTEDEYKEVAHLFETISGYQDSSALANKCYEKVKEKKQQAEDCERLFQAYKAALRNEEFGVDKKAEVERTLSWLTDQYESLSRLKNDWSRIEEELYSLNKEAVSLQTEISKLNNEKRTLGLFAGKAKKELVEKINNFEKDKSALFLKIENLEKQKQGHTSISELYNQLNGIEQQIDEQKCILEELSCVKSSKELRAELNNYSDGQKLLEKYDRWSSVKVDSFVQFGEYDHGHGIESIEWHVLEVENGKALVISKYGLDCKQYHSSRTAITWETCTLREWLNNEFFNAAFSADEKAMIPTVTVLADENPKYNSTHPKLRTDAGNVTQDKVFLLSISEVCKYLSSNNLTPCKPTRYAVKNGARTGDQNNNCFWWLRTPGCCQHSAADVNFGGGILELGECVDIADHAVRPAMWIDWS